MRRRQPSRNAGPRRGGPPSRDLLAAAKEAHRAGRLAVAEGLYARIIESAPDAAAEAHFHLGNALRQQGRLADAAESYRRAAALAPRAFHVFVDLGLTLQLLGDHAAAETAFRRALALDPRSPGAHLGLGIALADQGRLEAAIAAYRAALALDPKAAPAHVHLGMALEQQHRVDDAIQCYERAVTLDPSDTVAFNNLGSALRDRGLLDEAVAAYRKALEIDPQAALVHVNLGMVLEQQRRVEDAIRCYERAIALDPRLAEAHKCLGVALRDRGLAEAAIRCFERALALKPLYGEAYSSLVGALHAQNRLADAMARITEWLARDPGNPIALHLRAAYSGEAVPPRASDAYVRELFDTLATTFDDHLARLGYRAPQLLIEAVGRALGAPERSLEVLDAGCGTGLCGPLLLPFARRLTGIDLAEGMLAKARQRQVYDELVAGELGAFLAGRRQAYDLILLADTLVYFGDLAAVAAAAAGALRAGGLIAASLERLDAEAGAADYRLEKHGRYRHAESYLRQVVADAGLVIAVLEPMVPRIELGAPVPGLLVVARKPAG